MSMKGPKNIIIIALIAINAALFAFGLYNTFGRDLDRADRMKTVRSVLSDNNIQVEAGLPDYTNLRKLSLTPYDFSEAEILDIFFDGNGDNVVKSETPGTYKYTLGDESVEYDAANYKLYYVNTGDGQDAAHYVSADEKYAACESYLNKIHIKGLTFRLDYSDPDAEVVEYRTVYHGKTDFVIYSNLVRFAFSSDGIIQSIRLSASVPSGLTGDDISAYPIDEALFKLMFRLKDDYGDPSGVKTIVISGIDVVYNADDTLTSATPYYRFYIRPDIGENVLGKPYLVNVKTGDIS